MLYMQAYQHDGLIFDKAGDGPGAAGDPERIELLPGRRFNHAMQLLKVESGVVEADLGIAVGEAVWRQLF